jgi:hypothetical protein
MTLDEIITALKSTNAVPTAALAAGVALADGIPVIWGVDNGHGSNWDRPERAPLRREPRRATKIARNAPCSFGSDKKFEKCCGSGTAPLAH